MRTSVCANNMYLRLFLTVLVIYRYLGNTSCQDLSGRVCDNGEQSICKCEYHNNSTKVNCTGRGLTRLPAGIPENTTHLYLDNNNLINIDDDALLRLSLLQEISLSFNKLTRLPRFPKYIRKISAMHNALQSIDGAFVNLTQLDRVNLDWNQVKVLNSTTFKDAMFHHFEMSHTPLEVIEPYTFAGLKNITAIDIRTTQVRALSENSFLMSGENRMDIKIEGRFLTNMSSGTFRNIPSGSTISMRYCNIISIPARVINGSLLIKLTLSHNGIQYIDPDAFIELDTVHDLNLFDNLLTVFPRALFNLRVGISIDISWNNISSLGNGPILKYSPYKLLLSKNQIQNISRDNFSGLESLNYMMLLQNKITYIDDSAFSGTNIAFLFVQGNFLTHITNETFYVKTGVLNYLYVYDNPLQMIENNALSHMALNSTVYLKCESLKNIPSTLSESINACCVTNTTEIIFDKLILPDKIRLYGIACNETRCTPCRQGHFGEFRKKRCYACPPGGFYQDQLGMVEKGNFKANCKKCPIGSFSPHAGAISAVDCQPCPAGTRTDRIATLNACDCLDNFHRTDRYGPCQPCPEGVNCSDGVQRLIQGYWWSWNFPADLGSLNEYEQFVAKLKNNTFNKTYPDFLKNSVYNGLLPAVHVCPWTKSCNGTNCSDGYSGWLCAACSPNYYELFNECRECQHIATIITVVVVVTLILAGVGYVVWKLDRRGRGRNDTNRMGSFVTHMKIAINFYQILGILSEVNEIHWPDAFQSVGQSLQYLDIIRYINILSPKCIFSGSWNAYTLLHIAIVTPFIIVLLTSMIFFLWHILNRYRGDHSAHHLKDKCLSITIMMLYLTYANTCSNIMAVGSWSIRTFDVTADGNYTKKVLTSDYSIDVDVDDGSVYDINTNIVYCSLMYVVGFPLAVVVVLYCRYKRHEVEHRDNERPEILGLKFFCRQYSTKFWYWEIFEMYNKAILALIANFKDDQASNMSYSLFVTVILIALHLYLEPMKAKSEQRFQLLTLLFIIVNLSVGAIVDLDATQYTADDTITVLHDITPFMLLLLNLSILFVVFVDLIKKVKEDIWKGWKNHHLELRNAASDTYFGDDDDDDDDAIPVTYRDASSPDNSSISRQVLSM